MMNFAAIQNAINNATYGNVRPGAVFLNPYEWKMMADQLPPIDKGYASRDVPGSHFMVSDVPVCPGIHQEIGTVLVVTPAMPYDGRFNFQASVSNAGQLHDLCCDTGGRSGGWAHDPECVVSPGSDRGTLRNDSSITEFKP